MLGLFAGMSYAEEAFVEEVYSALEYPEAIELPSEEELLSWLEQYFPEGLEELRMLQQEMPDEYEEEMSMYAETMVYLEEWRKIRPEMFTRLIEAEKLEHTSWKLAEKIEETDDEHKKKELRSELRTMLTTIFDVRIEEYEIEIQELEKELQEMKSLVKKRKAMKEDVIDRHMMELLDVQDDALGWW
jgi:hypothetical protein